MFGGKKEICENRDQSSGQVPADREKDRDRNKRAENDFSQGFQVSQKSVFFHGDLVFFLFFGFRGFVF